VCWAAGWAWSASDGLMGGDLGPVDTDAAMNAAACGPASCDRTAAADYVDDDLLSSALCMCASLGFRSTSINFYNNQGQPATGCDIAPSVTVA